MQLETHSDRSMLARHTGAGHARLRLGLGAAIGLLILALVIGVAISAFAPRGSARTLTKTTGAPTPVAGVAPQPTVAMMFVHVLGAVHKPGLFELPTGSRVVDAIAAAGGLRADADPAGVNLARQVADGEQLAVPKVGEVAPRVSGQQSAGIPGKINLNTASEADFETLPRIGPTMAARIISWRSTNGPFRHPEDLMNVPGIGDATFAGLKDLIMI